jgi:hypothetical protein
MQKRQLGRNGLEVSVLGGVPPDVATSASKCRVADVSSIASVRAPGAQL